MSLAKIEALSHHVLQKSSSVVLLASVPPQCPKIRSKSSRAELIKNNLNIISLSHKNCRHFIMYHKKGSGDFGAIAWFVEDSTQQCYLLKSIQLTSSMTISALLL
jgi:hypothetical protein